MKRLLLVVVLLGLVLVGVDVASRIAMEHQLEQRINSYAPTASSQVSIHSFPFFLKLATQGRVDKITAHARQVSQGPFVLDAVDVTVTGVRINRQLFLHHRQLEIVAIDRGTVTADMTQADFSRLIGVSVTLGNGTAQVAAAGITVSGQVSISNGRLLLTSSGVPCPCPSRRCRFCPAWPRSGSSPAIWSRPAPSIRFRRRCRSPCNEGARGPVHQMREEQGGQLRGSPGRRR
jgi:hypothetical protein